MEELIDRANDVISQWVSISEKWHALELEYVLAQAWPLNQRFLLDRLLDDTRLMSEFCDELRHEVFVAEYIEEPEAG
jgi:hypothetical protein